MIAFTLHMTPKSLQHGNKTAMRHGRITFFRTPEKKAYQAMISALCMPHRPASPLAGPVGISLRFYLPRPQKLDGKKFSGARELCGSRPDWDNISKGSIDGLSSSGFWLDDKQIARAVVEKWYHERGGAPRIEVEIEAL